MHYAILCYHSEEVVCSWTKEEDDAVMAGSPSSRTSWLGRASSARSRGCCRPPRRPRCARTASRRS